MLPVFFYALLSWSAKARYKPDFITALADNLPSRRTIEGVGGKLQDVIDFASESMDLPAGRQLAHYWVYL